MSFVQDIRPGPTPAILTPSGALSYTELVARIDKLARMLVAQGIGTDQVVAVALERGHDPVVAIGAVLRAGAAFLAVDVDLPPARIDALISGTQALITSPALAGRFAASPRPGPTIQMDDSDAPGPPAQLPSALPARSLAYISHTSGSTGAPNAVMIEHGGLDAYLRFLVQDYRLGPHTTAVQLAPLGYDASIRDTFAPLLAGGRVVVLPRAALLRAEEFFEAVTRYGINTILSATPSFLTFLARQPAAAQRLRDLTLVVASGESMRPFLAGGGRRVAAGRLVNQYGPTECTMTSTRFAVPTDPELSVDLVGTPIDGVHVRLLDEHVRTVPDGSVGEIFIGGGGVARGYAARPGLTADRFRPDPLGTAGSRIYRTGDLARKRPDGNLEYLGRGDRQIKIRGYRVDPAEVEAALLTHPAVTGAAVVAGTDAQERIHLIAHVCGDLESIRDATLRAHLAQTLPPHLMPRRFCRIERIPTTSSGKTDRTQLTAAAGRIR